MDIIFLSSPFFDDYIKSGKSSASPQGSPYKPENRKSSGMPEPGELLDRYAELVGFDLRKDGRGKDWEVGAIFQFIRSSTISHGIQARTISGQASSDFGHLYFEKTRDFFKAALRRMANLKKKTASSAKL